MNLNADRSEPNAADLVGIALKLLPPHNTGNNRYALLCDPDGNLVERI